MTLRIALGVPAACACVLALPSLAAAFVASDVVQGSRTVSGIGCGGLGQAIVRMPPKTLSARIVDPKVGGLVYRDGHVIARLPSRSIQRDGVGLFARFIAMASDDVCANPFRYPNGWSGYLDYYVDVRRRVQVYARTDCRWSTRARPRTIVVDCSRDRNLTLRNLRWRRWGGRVARGRGTYVGNDCWPTCAAGQHHSYRVRLALTRPISCSSQWSYGRVVLTFAGSRPKGLVRGRRYSLPFGGCADGQEGDRPSTDDNHSLSW